MKPNVFILSVIPRQRCIRLLPGPRRAFRRVLTLDVIVTVRTRLLLLLVRRNRSSGGCHLILPLIVSIRVTFQDFRCLFEARLLRCRGLIHLVTLKLNIAVWGVTVVVIRRYQWNGGSRRLTPPLRFIINLIGRYRPVVFRITWPKLHVFLVKLLGQMPNVVMGRENQVPVNGKVRFWQMRIIFLMMIIPVGRLILFGIVLFRVKRVRRRFDVLLTQRLKPRKFILTVMRRPRFIRLFHVPRLVFRRAQTRVVIVTVLLRLLFFLLPRSRRTMVFPRVVPMIVIIRFLIHVVFGWVTVLTAEPAW